MPFEYACFISYRNGLWENNEPQKDLLNTCACQLHDALESVLRTLVDFPDPVFLDQRNLTPGQCTVPKISEALCKSVCILVVYTPNYLSNIKMFCATELYGIEQLQNQRNTLLPENNRASTPIFVAKLEDGEQPVPSIFKERIYLDLSKFELGQRRLSLNTKYNKKIRGLAREIAQFYRTYCSSIESQLTPCKDFRIPDTTNEEECKLVKDFIESINPPTGNVPDKLPFT